MVPEDIPNALYGFTKEMQEVFDQLLAEEGVERSERIAPRAADAVPLLSFAQQRMWLLDNLNPGSNAYNVAGAVRLKGELDHDVLKRSLNEVIRRHESLRTTFHSQGTDVIQAIAPPLDLEIGHTDLRTTPESLRERELCRTLSEVSRIPFNLSEGPLFRVYLICLSDEEHVLLMMMHHIISDARSTEILIKEITGLYSAFKLGQPSPFADLPVQYADFALWQREWLSGERLDTQLAYWKQQLSGELPVIDLPTDRLRPAVPSTAGREKTFHLGPELTGQLRQLSRRENVTLFTSLLATFKVLLWRYTGQEDIIVGTTVAGRNRSEVEDLVGFFVNVLVLRTDLSGNPTFVELLHRVNRIAVESLAHQDLPFERLVEDLQPARKTNRTPLFQILFSYQNAALRPLTFPGLTITPEPIESDSSKTEMSFLVRESDDDVEVTIVFNSDLFLIETIERLGRHFDTLLHTVADSPSGRLLHLSETIADRQLLQQWNQTETPYERDHCIHVLFEEQVRRTPEQLAVVDDASQLTYRELNKRANQLAHYLQRNGVGPEVTVGLLLARSVDWVTAMLAVLKAGGVYVPLDTGLSPQRIAFILKDARVQLLITHRQYAMAIDFDSEKIIDPDQEEPRLRQESEADCQSVVEAENLAYVIYTSGSTGLPKGVAVCHRNLVNYTTFINRQVLGSDSEPLNFALASTPAADLGNTSLFPALTIGGCLHILSDEVSKDGLKFAEYLTEHPIDVLKIVPSHLRSLYDSAESSRVLPRRKLILGGEVLSNELLRELGRHQYTKEIVNHYGPTEATIGSLTCSLGDGTQTQWSSSIPPIGRPIANAKAYILDDNLNPVPIGVRGQLCLGGQGIARGYFGKPGLTAEKFVPDHLSGGAGERLYLTGDMCRYLADGNIQFLGRIDHQVKFIGHRIELQGIRALLNDFPAIEDSVVLVQTDSRANQLLVAYYLASRQLAAEELRAWLRNSLAEETIPGLFIHLKEMPLTANGKIDHSALPSIEDAREKLEPGTAARQNLMEQIISGIWSHVLGLKHIPGDANFFELGGHSLLATQVVSRVRKALGVELLLPTFFKDPTITGLARVVNARLAHGQRATIGDIPAASRNCNAPLSYSQQRLWFLNQLAPDSPFYNVSGSIHLQGRLDLQALERAFNEVIRRHEILRTSFPLVDGKPVQQINQWTPITLSPIDLSALSPDAREQKRQRLENEHARLIFDLTTGPLISPALLRLGPEEHVVNFTVHHIISDGWSMSVFIREIASLYEAFSSGQPSPLPELRIQYADYAIWQRDRLEGEVLNEQLTYWKEQLAGAPSLLQLPTFKARPMVQSFRGANRDFRLSPELSQAIRKLSGSEGVTLFITLLAAFQTLLYRYTGQTDVVVGSPIAGRNHLDTEDLIGFFVNTLVLRSKLRPDMTFRQLLDQVRQVALGAHAHQDLPFERLVEELQPERNLSYAPLFQVLFVLRNMPEQKLELPGLRLTVTGLQSDTAKFDLVLVLTDSEDGLFGAFQYNSELFAPELIEQLNVHFKNLLQSIVAAPAASLSALPVLDELERRQLLYEINNTTVEYPRHRCINELFEEQAANTPRAAAVHFDGETLNYGELNRRANQLAHYLRREGVGPETLVGVAVEPSVERVVGLLAILKAGGAYVPLDPEYPVERLLFIIKDAGVSVLLTQQRLWDALSTQPVDDFPATLTVLCLDGDWSMVQEESEENPANEATPDNLAYVIYTSGSTGIPKGVSVPHRGVIRLVCNTNYVKLNSSVVMAQASNLSFDASTFELWGVLLHGGQLVVLSRDLLLSPEKFSVEIARLGINTMLLATTLFHQIARSAPQAFKSLRCLLFGGEPVDPHCVKAVLEQGAPEQLLNVYGPTENSVISTHHRVENVAADASMVPIGGPITNTQVYVLDQRLEPVPIGVAGELYLGGEGLAREYLRRPDLTAEKFVPNPFGPPGTRLYRTGDAVRIRDNGAIDFLGRLDDQIKLRGFRIELGEIEARLRKDERVKDAVVVVTNTGADKQLIAFVEPALTGLDLEGQAFRERLKQQLPGFMIPAAVFIRSQLPVTSSGKVDRQALVAIAGQTTMLSTESLPPRTETERQVAQIWSEVLNEDAFGVNDNFFDLGGHSLRAAQVITRINEVFDIVMPVRSMFELPTIANLADNIDDLRWLKSGPDGAATDSITLQTGEL